MFQYEDLEITLLEVVTHGQIVTGGYYYYYSKPGETFIDVTALVRNEKSQPVYIIMSDLYIVEEAGDAC